MGRSLWLWTVPALALALPVTAKPDQHRGKGAAPLTAEAKQRHGYRHPHKHSLKRHHKRHHRYGHHKRHHRYGLHKRHHIRHHHKHYGYRAYYHFSDLGDVALFALIGGITYAIVDNHYYRRQGDLYVLSERPRPGNYRVLSPAEPPHGDYAYGQRILRLPEPTRVVEVDDLRYWVHRQHWFLSLGPGKGYVVVKPPLSGY